jgi:hypothetical protein
LRKKDIRVHQRFPPFLISDVFPISVLVWLVK